MQKQSTILKRNPATYVKSIAMEMAHGAFISGSEILQNNLAEAKKCTGGFLTPQ
jgi:hypothetical protein